MAQRFEVHAHTEYSNLRLLDCINKPKDLIDRAIKLGLSGVSITDHECLSSHMGVNIYAEEINKKYPDFKIALGNEIYLTKTREPNQKYYHFILIAKNKTGHRALRELSSRAWMNSYMDRGLERVPTLYSDLYEIVQKYPNSLIATTACLGGELPSLLKEIDELKAIRQEKDATQLTRKSYQFIDFCKTLFKEDFYIECAPGCSPDQILVNKELKKVADNFNIKMVIGTDAHFLTPEDRFVHKAYLNSKNGEREVDLFYEYAYLQSEEDIIKNLKPSGLDYEELCNNSMEIWNKIENYSLRHNQTIPKVEVKNYHKKSWTTVNGVGEQCDKYPILSSMLESDDKVERYWVNECINKLYDLGIIDSDKNEIYLSRLEEEADIKKTIGEKLGTNMFAYPVTLQHYVDMFWECGSTVGAGRGSSCAGLNHYLLGVTQLDPIKWELPFFRYLNKDRVELGCLILILPSCK